MYEVAVIGLGYVGLPLAEALSVKNKVVGVDINTEKIKNIQQKEREGLRFSDSYDTIMEAEYIIVTVPTPVDVNNIPDLKCLEDACVHIGQKMRLGATVIFESTVYPGCTEEVCVPILEKNSGRNLNEGFFVAYSPERINPGDKIHTLERIVKIVGASHRSALTKVIELYKTIIHAGVYEVSSIKVAEAAKVIENAQRDLNISFVNELALIFDRIGIDTQEVLNAAATKWNFLPFKPGLVGGHCISVDPYYLAFKSEMLGYVPEVLLSGRRVNNFMGRFIAQKVVKLMLAQDMVIKGADVLVLGFSFKENWPDVRNTKVYDLVSELKDFGVNIDIYDPIADTDAARSYGIELLRDRPTKRYQACILAVAHECFTEVDVRGWTMERAIIFDVKGVLPKSLKSYRL